MVLVILRLVNTANIVEMLGRQTRSSITQRGLFRD